MSAFSRAALCLLVALPAVAQSRAFATVTIRPARSTDPRDERTQVLPSGEWIASGVTVNRLMNRAYGLPANGSIRFPSCPTGPSRRSMTLTQRLLLSISPGLQDNEFEAELSR